MASISLDRKTGRRTIQYVGMDGKRRSVRLGKVNQKLAEQVKVRVENLAAAQATGHVVDADTIRWLSTIEDSLADKLAAVGLIQKRDASALAGFIDGYVTSRTDLKPRTVFLCIQARGYMVDYFGESKLIRSITPGDGDEFRLHLLGKGLAENTTRRVIGRCKQFFNAAVRRKLIHDNPFADLSGAVRATPERFHFISREDADKIIDACPTAEWRLIFALSRFGGLRCPSEHLALRLDDIDWANDRINVRSPKTEHHEGKDSRWIPLFPELRPWLLEVAEQAEPGAEYVITSYRDDSVNLRTGLLRILKRAGVKVWPKLFQNLRSTRETELAETFPMHVVCGWIGNSQPVAMKHYLQTTDEHFRQAVQNPVQQTAEGHRTASQTPNERPRKEKPQPRAMQGAAVLNDSPRRTAATYLMPPQGLEP